MIYKSKKIMEIWKDIDGFIGIYQVSNLGNVRSLDRSVYYKNDRHEGTRIVKGSIIKPHSNRGYSRYNLWKDSIVIKKSGHRLVYETFIGYTDLEIDHINDIKSDNRLENLQALTPRENTTKRSKTRRKSELPVGVYENGAKKYGKMYRACIYMNGTQNYLGSFDSIYEAEKAYKLKLESI